MAGRQWSPEEDALLRASSSRLAREIAAELGRTPEAVKARRKTLGIAQSKAPPVDWSAPTVQCSRCGQHKSTETEYYPERLGKRARICKDCRRAEKNRRYTDNVAGYRDRERARAAERSAERAYIGFRYRLRLYGLTEAQYEAMWLFQGGRCGICWLPESKIHQTTGEVQRLSIDHDHVCCPGESSCGQCVRGLLCSECNQVLGKLEERRLLPGIVAYLGTGPST